MSMRSVCAAVVILTSTLAAQPARAQQLLGSMNGTVTDRTGGVVPQVQVKAVNLATAFERTTVTDDHGDYNLFDLPIGTYRVSFAKENFTTETHSQIIVQGNRTTTVPGRLEPGQVSTTITVTSTPLLNSSDTTNGYVLNPAVIEAIPLGTGSFTQLAILSPGVNADMLAGSDSNAGLGNQAIWANGQRDTSNSFSFNAVNANNVFNGKSSSSVGSNRFILSTGENFLAGGYLQTGTSVYDAIGQGLPTPPPETIEELRVNTSMYDASQGANSGAHIDVITRSGTNNLHGQLYGFRQSSGWNAAPFFFNADSTIPQSQKVPDLHRSTFGGTTGGPIKRDKMFFFTSYQGVRVRDQFNGTSRVTVPLGLTDDRKAKTLATEFSNVDPFVGPITAAQIDPAALALLNAKAPGGGFLIPTPAITDPGTASAFGYDVLVTGPPATFTADQLNGNIDYTFSDRDRLAAKYYFQHNPNTSPFGVNSGSLLGFSQRMNAGSQVISLDNTTILSPTVTWEQKIGFIREIAFSTTQQFVKPSDVGINLPGSTRFPGLTIDTPEPAVNSALTVGPASPFANAGVFQNQFDAGTNLNWVRGKHSFAFGANWDRNQLNVVNQNNQVAGLEFFSFPAFLTGSLRLGEEHSVMFQGASNRYYRSNQMGSYAQDNIKLRPGLTLNLGLRFDYDGPLSEKHGLLTSFYAQLYKYDPVSDKILNDGLVIAGNNSRFHTPGVSNSTLLTHQYGFAPRVGVAWSPTGARQLVLRAGVGLYYDRGQFFTEFSPSAGFGFNGPFGVTLEPPFVLPFESTGANTLSNPFGAPPPPPSGDPAAFAALLPNIAQLTSGNLPPGNEFGPFLFGGYDPSNKLPYSENWSLDLQWQPLNNLVLTLAYVGNHGVHGLQPIPFNQPQIATTLKPINGQSYSFGFTPLDSTGNALLAESVPGQNGVPLNTTTGGNTDLRVPYIGYSPNSVFYEAEGISNYHALQFGVNKRLGHGLQVNGSYTWSHALDEGSGLGLFFNGNDPLNLRSAYGSSDFDRTHVLAVSYLYQFPKVGNEHSLAGKLVNGWGFSGITVFQSGQPYSVYDYTGSIAGLYYSSNDYITNPLVPLAPGFTSRTAQLQGTTGVNAGKPALNSSAFALPALQPGQDGVPPCGTTIAGQPLCDNVETGYGNAGRNLFRGPFQERFDFSIQKQSKLTERFSLKYSADFFNLLNHPSFDTPNNNVKFNPCYNPQPCYTFPPLGSLGFIQHTLGSPRFIQMSLHLMF